MYVLFRSLVLLGVIGFGVGSACSTLIDWWRGSSITPLHLEPVALNTVLMTALCGQLAWRHRRIRSALGMCRCCCAQKPAIPVSMP